MLLSNLRFQPLVGQSEKLFSDFSSLCSINYLSCKTNHYASLVVHKYISEVFIEVKIV